MDRRLKTFLKMLALVIGLLLVFKESHLLVDKNKDTAAGGESNTSYDFAMGTSLSLTLYLEDGDLDNAKKTIFQYVKDLDEGLISWRETDSELGKLDKEYKANVPYEISDDLYGILVATKDICKETNGALDFTIRPLANTWDIENATKDTFKVPTKEEIEASLALIDYKGVSLDIAGDKKTVTLSKDNMILDLGAVGKGYALDYVLHQDLDSLGKINGMNLSVGGSILVYGEKPNKEPWKVGIRNPKGSVDELIGYVEIPAGNTKFISTSGDYEKYIEKDGKIYHHILDESTGYPVEGSLASVTIVCDNGLMSDALSTACFVLGEEEARKVLEYYGADAIFIDHENNITCTEGVEGMFHKLEE